MNAMVKAVGVGFGHTRSVIGMVGTESDASSGARVMVRGGAR